MPLHGGRAKRRLATVSQPIKGGTCNRLRKYAALAPAVYCAVGAVGQRSRVYWPAASSLPSVMSSALIGVFVFHDGWEMKMVPWRRLKSSVWPWLVT